MADAYDTFKLEDILGYDLQELFKKHEFDYAIATRVDLNFIHPKTKKAKIKVEIGWGEMDIEDVFMRNCNGKDCPNRGYWDNDETRPKGKGCYYGESLQDVLKAEGIEY